MVQSLPYQMKFEKSGVTLSPLMPLILGVFVGILAAIMGVGGGFIMVPVMVYMLRMPMHVVVGTSLFQILFTCINVTIMQSITNYTVDLVLAIILLLGSTTGAQFGVRLSRRLKARPAQDSAGLHRPAGDGADAGQPGFAAPSHAGAQRWALRCRRLRLNLAKAGGNPGGCCCFCPRRPWPGGLPGLR